MRSPLRRLLCGALLTTAALGAGATPALAGAPFPITESFTHTTMQSGWYLGGAASLTASADGDGNGWLRLTPALGTKFGYVFDDVAFPSDRGVLAEFDYATWGGTGADGLVFFLYDGSTTSDQFSAGPAGGSLGYSACPSTGQPGLHNAYVGVGLDEWGNFALASFCNQGGVENGSNLLKNRVTVRAGEAAGYGVLASQPTDQSLLATRAQARHVTVAINDGKLQTYIRYPDGSIQTVAKDVPMPAGAPSTLKLGFVASTGGSTNNHEIRNTKVVEPVDIRSSVTDGHTGNDRGVAHTWTATAHNASANDAGTVSFKASSSAAGMTGVSWTCASDDGTCGEAAGVGYPDTTLSLPAGATATYTITADSTAVTDEANLSVDAEPTGDTGELAPLDNTATDTTQLPPVNDVAPAFHWDGTTATVTDHGMWRGGGIAYTYAWETCAADGTDCVDSGQTGSTYTPAADVTGGTIRLAVTATNDAGEATAHSDPYVLPETEITSGPSGTIAGTSPSFGFSGTGSAFDCRLDGGSWSSCSGSWSDDVTEGEHTFEVRSRSGVLADATPAARTFTADAHTTAELVAPAAGLTADPRPTVTVQGSEDGTFDVSVDGDVVGHGVLDADHRGSLVLPDALTDGDHVISVEVTDAVGNTAEDHETITVDATAPRPAVVSGPPPVSTRERRQVISWNAEDGSTSRCRVDGGTWATCTSPLELDGLTIGDHVVDIEVVDAAGNVSDRQTLAWTVTGSGEAPVTTPVVPKMGAPVVCASRRAFDVHWTLPHGVKARSSRVSVDGRPGRRLGAARRSWHVDLRGRARTQVSVRIVTTARNGRRYASTRVYQPCKAGRSRALPTILLKRTK